MAFDEVHDTGVNDGVSSELSRVGTYHQVAILALRRRPDNLMLLKEHTDLMKPIVVFGMNNFAPY